MDGGLAKSRPFQVVVPEKDDAPVAAELPPEDAGWSVQDLEAEYMKAVEAAEQAELLSEIAIDEAAVEPVKMPAAEAVEDTEPEPAAEPQQLNIAPGQVLEALLFVGGTALSPRRLADVINVSTTEIELLVDTLNGTYLEERRPYHIDLDDGHYRLALHAEFEPIRSRVHGQGPKDVRLAPDALEVLALVAYEQPLSKEDLDGSGKPEADTLVRQLIRRDLVSLTRGEDKQIHYRTTPRFLELFGLRSLNDLPRSEMLRFK